MRVVVASIIRRQIFAAMRGQGIGRKRRETVFREIGEHLGQIETLVAQHPFILGDALTLADIAVFAQIDGLLTPLTPDTKKEGELRDRLMAWYHRVEKLTRQS